MRQNRLNWYCYNCEEWRDDSFNEAGYEAVEAETAEFDCDDSEEELRQLAGVLVDAATKDMSTMGLSVTGHDIRFSTTYFSSELVMSLAIFWRSEPVTINWQQEGF